VRLYLHRHIIMATLLCTCLHVTPCHAEPEKSGLEDAICGVKEPFVFWLWSSVAGGVDPARVEWISNIEDVAITSTDGRVLRGYKLKAAHSREGERPARGYLLVAQGNAMLADQIIARFDSFADQGYDVYIFDYRGYGRSEGKRRLKAILHDYRVIIEYLDRQSYRERAFYGMSFGGIVLLNALHDQSGAMSIVIDSTPSNISDYGCPAVHDPLGNLPRNTERLLVMAGASDRVVKPAATRALLDEAERQGAVVLRDPELGHPFMDDHTARRMEIVRRFLTGKGTRHE